MLLTPPIPQTFALLDAGQIEIESELKQALASIVYDPCFAVMARLDGPSGLPAPGFVSGLSGPVAWIADNQTKGISDVPAVTIHASAEFSRPYGSSDCNEVGRVDDDAAHADIHVVHIDGTSEVNLSRSLGYNEFGDWSSDSLRIAFVSSRDGNNEIYVMRADGTMQTRITNNDFDDGWPSWSPF